MQTRDGRFPTTQWTLVARLKSGDADIAQRALDDLCTQYHYPLYCYIRRRGLEHHDAQDALHDFLAKLLRLGTLHTADLEKGHLRAFLATALQRFLVNWHRDHRRQARELSVDAEASLADSEERYQKERFTEADTPENIFERKWAQELLRRVLHRLGEDYAASGKTALFKRLRPVLLRGGSLRGEDVAAIAESLDMKEPALRMAHSRLLRDYRQTLEDEVHQTVADASEIAEEIAHLRGLFGGK